MKSVFFFVLLFSLFFLPSNGQIREIYEDGKIVNHNGGGFFISLGEAMFSYRVVYGRYPDEKRILLDYFLEVSKDEYDDYKADSTMIGLLAKRDSILTVDLNDPDNELTVSGDTCTFSYAKPTREYTFYSIKDTVGVVRKLSAVQCIGGPAELQKYDYSEFRSWMGSSFYDKEGRPLWSLSGEAPMMPREVNRQFRYVVTMKSLHEGEASEDWTSFVFIPITMTRSGAIRYDLSCLEGIQLFFQELGTSHESTNILGTIAAEEAIDPDRLDAVKAYLKSFLDQHEEVDSIKTWELVLFNNPPGVTTN